MKYRIFTVIIILVALFGTVVSAVGYDYNISPGDTFTYAKYGDDLTQISQKLNMTTSELNSYFNQNGLIYLAVSDDKKSQIKISAFTDNFSSVAGDISNLDDSTLTEFANAVGQESGVNADTVLNNGRKFVCIKTTRQDSGGIYTITQYITICNSKTFYFAGYNDGEDTSQEILSAFDSFELFETTVSPDNYNLILVFTVIGIVVFSIIAIVMIIGILKSKSKTTQVK